MIDDEKASVVIGKRRLTLRRTRYWDGTVCIVALDGRVVMDAVIDAAIEAMPRVLENIEGLDGDILDQCEGVLAAVAGDRKKTIGQGI